MKCIVDGCDRDAMYKKQCVCQKHYFRKMRYGTYDLTNIRKYKIFSSNGYIKLYEPDCILSDGDGYVYEHRFVYLNSGKQTNKCEMCNKDVSWKSLHIDHINNDRKNNNIENLQVLCRPCNTFKDATNKTYSKELIEYNGIELNAFAWARRDDVNVSGNTIKRRIRDGYSIHDAIYGDKITHKQSNNKKHKTVYVE